jgi:hypothetical protein
VIELEDIADVRSGAHFLVDHGVEIEMRPGRP